MNREDILIEADELASKISDPNLRLFDATVLLTAGGRETGLGRYLAGHIPGAAFLDHGAVSDASVSAMFMLPGEQALGDAIGKLGIGNDNEVVVYSSDQIMWATRIWWVLRYAGHRKVRVLNGGLTSWTGELETAENNFEATRFEINLSPSMIADRQEVLAAIDDGGVCTLNALPYSFYTGEADIPYAKEGHITGSLSLPFEKMMDGAGMKSNEDLVQAYSEYASSDRLITYCGGGIAATLNACAALLAGHRNVAVYDGSMSEWLQEGMPTTKGDRP